MSGATLALAVCVCGGAGAALRYICDTLIKARWSGAFPLSTFVINVTAGFLAGIVTSLHGSGLLAEPWRLALAVGVLGGFSTFSTAINEMVTLAAGGRRLTALAYLLASIAAPVAAVAGGALI